MVPSFVWRSTVAIVAASLLSSPAWADDGRARAAFEEGLRLLDKKEHAPACAKFRESLAAAPSVGAMLNVAMCSTRENKLATAQEEYRALLVLNEATADPERRKNVDARAREAMRSLSPRVPTLELTVTPAPEALTLELDDKPFERTRLGSAQPVDPGEHIIKVSAQGFHPLEKRITLRESERQTHALTLEPIRGAASDGDRDGNRDAPMLAGWVTGGAGLAGLATGAALLGVASMRASEIEDLCGDGATPPVCDQPANAGAATRLSEEGSALEVGGFVSLGLGAALVTTGAVLVGTALGSAGGVAFLPVGPHGPGLGLVASF
ncbi:MAG: PEGA domain-containing protein [Myxococcales bacterium]|nr:PEGA domain-containing protein [Myxococcales bacterium]